MKEHKLKNEGVKEKIDYGPRQADAASPLDRA